ncbi:glycosyltransferase family A protein [Saccharopolyspora sp. NPDC000359]|uniref:glycosyltransferase family 2 protein n=1 Tax=Saccharopolyspora sp. NPDC000359 TaxID=3154251 RepID=UPI003333ADE3
MLVTVVTITRTRPELLARAMESVQEQDLDRPFEHLVVVDACPDSYRMLAARSWPDRTRWLVVSRTSTERSGPGRSSVLRNMAVRISDARWIAFIDDDNEWEPDHLSSLVACAERTGSRAVHSHLQMRYRDGRPYLEQRDPWIRDPAAAAAHHADLVRKGVVVPGSCVWRDRLDPPGTADPVVSVDTGEWLLARDLLLEVPFCETFTARDAANAIGEDDKLAAALHERGEPVASSGRPTLIYHLGGYSNDVSEPFDPTFSWSTEGDA